MKAMIACSMRAVMALAVLALCGVAPALAQRGLPAPPAWTKGWSEGVWLAARESPSFITGFEAAHDYANPNKKPPLDILTPEYAAKYEADRQAMARGFIPEDVDTYGQCKTPGLPYRLRHGYHTTGFLVTPGKVAMLFDNMYWRLVYMDGREHPKDWERTSMGHSVGHWEGDDLVVDTVGIKPGLQMDFGLPISDAFTMTERWTPISNDEVRLTLDFRDPKVLKAPQRVYVRFTRDGEYHVEFDCTENSRYAPNGARGVEMMGPDGKPLPKAED